jgi:hypothetical protein
LHIAEIQGRAIEANTRHGERETMSASRGDGFGAVKKFDGKNTKRIDKS